jgi:hypothetical protein
LVGVFASYKRTSLVMQRVKALRHSPTPIGTRIWQQCFENKRLF